MNETGKVLLRVYVNVEGRAEQIDIQVSSGFPRLDKAAIEAVKQWRFVPARQGEQPVAARVNVPITFQLSNG